MRNRWRIMAAVVAAGALAVGACGGDDGDSAGPGDGPGEIDFDGAGGDAMMDTMVDTLEGMGMSVDEDCLRDRVEELIESDPAAFEGSGAADPSIVFEMMDCIDLGGAEFPTGG